MKFLPFLFLLALIACETEVEVPPTKPRQVKPGNVQFYEVYTPAEFSVQWLKACKFSAESGKELMDLSALIQIQDEPAIGSVKEQYMRLIDSILAIPEIKKLFPEDLEFRWSYRFENTKNAPRYLYALKIPQNKIPRIDSRYVNSARTETNKKYGTTYIELLMTIDGTPEWEKMTKDNIGRYIAITIDDVVLSCPMVNAPIGSGTLGIEGDFSKKEAEEIAKRISYGHRRF